MAEPVIEIAGVEASWGGPPALVDVNLRVERGDFVAVLGPNGGGKTTLVKLILGLLAPSRGSVRVFGREPGQAAGLVGYMPQHTTFRTDFPIGVLEVVLMGLSGPGRRGFRYTAEETARARAALARVEMADFAARRIGDLSGGQRQRVFIARALVSEPKLLLLDEPTASVDAHGRFCFYELLAELTRDVTVLVVSHDLSIVSTNVTGVACVNRTLHYHPGGELTREMLSFLYGGEHGHHCPVMAFAHGYLGPMPKEGAGVPGVMVPDHTEGR